MKFKRTSSFCFIALFSLFCCSNSTKKFVADSNVGFSLQPSFSTYSKMKSQDAITTKILSDDSGSLFILKEKGDKGYSISDKETGLILESSDHCVSPYYGRSGDLKYYGPFNYFSNENNNFEHTITKNRFSHLPNSNLDIKATISKAGKKIDSNLPLAVSANDETITRLSNYESLINIGFFDYNKEEYGLEGTCGYVAAALCIWYIFINYDLNFIYPHENYIHGFFGYTLEFFQYLIEIGASMNIGRSTIARDVASILMKYGELNNHNIFCPWEFLCTQSRVNESIRKDHPVIIFGNFLYPDNSGRRGNHAVVVYGVVNKIIDGKQYRYLEVNYGWDGYTSVTILDELLVNPIGSTCYFQC